MDTLTQPVEGRAFRLALAPLREVVVRDAQGTGDGSWTMEGYAAVFEQETTLWDGRWLRMREEIARDAFDALMPLIASGDELVHFNFGHDMNTSIAASNVSGIGGLELQADHHGLHFFARVDPADPDAERLAVKMRRGIVKQASFAFTIGAEQLVECDITDAGVEDQLWRIESISHLYDVCACPQGAYPQTESHLRSLAAASLGRSGFDPEGLDRRSPQGEGEPVVAVNIHGSLTGTNMASTGDALVTASEAALADATSGGGDPARALRLAQLQAQAAVLVHDHPKG